jgi:hypothetical protein
MLIHDGFCVDEVWLDNSSDSNMCNVENVFLVYRYPIQEWSDTDNIFIVHLPVLSAVICGLSLGRDSVSKPTFEVLDITLLLV